MAFSLKNIFSSVGTAVKTGPSRVVGVDYGSSAIKVVELEQTEKAVTLRTYGELQLGPYADKPLGESVTLEQKRAVEALVDVVRESAVQAKTGVLAIPLSSSFVTVVPIETTAGEDLENKVYVEARKHIPVPLSDVMLDWTSLGEYGSKNERVNEVLLAAIQTDSYQHFGEIMRMVELAGQPAEIEVFSTLRGAIHPSDETLGIIDLGAETSKLYIARNGALERIHRVYEGGAACTKRLAKLLDVSFEEAEELKRQYTGAQSNHAHDVYKAYATTLERSMQEFQRVIEQYEARIGNQISRIVLTGGATAFPSAEKYIGDILQKNPERIFPFEKVAYPAFMEDTLYEVSVSFATALGAALRIFESDSA